MLAHCTFFFLLLLLLLLFCSLVGSYPPELSCMLRIRPFISLSRSIHRIPTHHFSVIATLVQSSKQRHAHKHVVRSYFEAFYVASYCIER